MFYLFYGDDNAKARGQAHKIVEAAKKKHAGAEYFKLTSESFSSMKLEDLIVSQGLFYSAFIVLSDQICTDAEQAEVLIKKLKEIKESPNFFVFLEGKLNKKELEKFEKYAEKIEEFRKPERKLNKKEELALKGEKIDFFEFANTLGERNKKLLWTLYQDALLEDVPAEEIHGIFFWQIKAMLAAVRCANAVEAGLNPYVYTKSKNYAKNFGTDEKTRGEKLGNMSTQLFEMYHEAHRGKIDFHIALEKFILAL